MSALRLWPQSAHNESLSERIYLASPSAGGVLASPPVVPASSLLPQPPITTPIMAIVKKMAKIRFIESPPFLFAPSFGEV